MLGAFGSGEVHRETVIEVKTNGRAVECVLHRGRSTLVSGLLQGLISPGDTMEFPLPGEGSRIGTEILILKAPNSRVRAAYLAPISYVTKPKEDRRGQLYSLAEVRASAVVISVVRLSCDVIRDYFYVTRTSRREHDEPSFYESLKATPSASLAELRLAYKIRYLELKTAHAEPRELRVIEQAFNILAEPDLRACYDALLKDPDAPAVFPYGGFGSLLVEGERSRDGKTFFVGRILAFSPDLSERSFDVPLRKFQFYDDVAIFRDARHRLELVVDQAAMPLVWDSTWNQWKHRLSAEAHIQATFLQTGVYRVKDGQWILLRWEKVLPSRIKVTLPADITPQIEAARRRHHVLGQHVRFFTQLRTRIDREPVAKSEIERLFGEVGIPGDFGAEQITWEADYDPFYYRELSKRARTVYFFRDEFIFELERAIVIERPELGHATYLFAKPVNMDDFLRLYARSTRQAIRANRDNVAERLGFIGRIRHAASRGSWVEQLGAELDEGICSTELDNGAEPGARRQPHCCASSSHWWPGPVNSKRKIRPGHHSSARQHS
jgi:hypothetical protein